MRAGLRCYQPYPGVHWAGSPDLALTGRCSIGDGDCDWPAVRKSLEEIGYQGWATAEVGGGDRARLKEIKERMDRVLG